MAYFWSQKHHQTSTRRPQTLLKFDIEVNVSYSYFRKDEKQDNSPICFSSGCEWLELIWGGSGCKARTRPGQDIIPSQSTCTHNHTHSHWCHVRMPDNLTCIALGCGRKVKYLQNPHAHMGRPCKLHIDCGPSRNGVFFSCTL